MGRLRIHEDANARKAASRERQRLAKLEAERIERERRHAEAMERNRQENACRQLAVVCRAKCCVATGLDNPTWLDVLDWLRDLSISAPDEIIEEYWRDNAAKNAGRLSL